VKDVALAAALVVIVAAGWAVVVLLRSARPRELPPARWAAAHHSLPKGGVEIVLECPGEEPVYFDTVQPTDPEFEDKLHLAMAEARARAAALNAER
jgi:hypothetical protein